MSEIDVIYMNQAYELAQQAQKIGEIPVGAVVVYQGAVIGRGFNQSITLNDPCAHAEIIALRAAANQLNNYRLLDCDLYVTLEPCPMCAGAMVHARIRRLVYAADDPKTGAVHSQLKLLELPTANHHIEITRGVMQQPCSTLLTAFFKQRRQTQKQQKDL